MKNKKLVSGLLAAVMLLSAAAPGGIIPRASAARVNTLGDGLVLYSTFDDGTAKDLSGSGHDGAVVGNIQFVEGKDGGKAVQITDQKNAGSDSLAGDRYIDYGASKNIIPEKGNFSTSLWFKSVGDATSNTAFLSNKNYSSAKNTGFAQGVVSSQLVFNFAASGASSAIEMAPGKSGQASKYPLMMGIRSDEQWHNLVCTYDRTGNMTAYVDGVKAGELSISAQNATIDAGLKLVLGAGGNYYNASNSCTLDDLLIYNRVLTQAEITLLAGKTAPDLSSLGLDEGILLDVDFEGNANDKSGNGYNGKTTGTGVTFAGSPFGGQAVKIVNKSAASGSANDNAVADSYVSFGEKISKEGLADKPFTLSFWYKPDPEMNSWGAVISNKDYGSGSNQGLALGYYTGNDCKMNVVPAGGKGTNTQVAGINLHQGGGWHHFTATVVPGGALTAYVDGVSVGTKAIPTGTIDIGLPLILGAGGNLKNPITNVQIDELRVYGRALGAADVAELYGINADKAKAANASMRIQEMLDALDKTPTGPLFPQESIDEMKERLTAALNELEGMTTEDTVALLARLEGEYQSFLNGKTPLASFHLISDVHVESSSPSDANALNYIAAMKDMKTLNADTTVAFVNIGDNTQSGQADQYTGFYNATAAHTPVSAEQTVILLGNHDVRGTSSGANWNADPSDPTKFPYWATAKNLYITNNAPYMPDDAKTTLYHSKTLGTVTDTEGYTFIMLNTELGLKDAMYMSDEQLAWFEQTMKEAYERNPEKPIFIVSHQALNDTHWRSNTLNGFDGIQTDGTGYPYQTGKDAAVKAVMEKYPNGIFLSGHIHNGFGVASVIPRSYGVNVDVPSLNETENGVKDQGVGYEVMIYEGSVAFRARNFITGSWLPQYDIAVPVGGSGYPQLIQELAPAMSDLLWYSEEDAAKLQEAFGTFWNVVDQYYNQAGIAYNAKPPANLIFTPDQLAELPALAEETRENLGILSTVTRLSEPRKGAFEVLRNKWRAYLLGGTGDDLDLSNSAVEAYVEGLNTEAAEYWNSMVKSSTAERDDLWLDLDMTPIKDYSDGAYTRSGNMATTFTRLRSIAYAWGTVGCDFYQNDYVRDELVKALDYLMTSYFPYGEKGYGNWYHWEITAPTALMNITMVLYDELTPEQIATYTKNAKWYVPYCDKGGPNSNGPKMTGGNLLLKANAAAQIGILSGDKALLDNVKAGVKTTLTYNSYATFYKSDADGFYADGSYIQHQGLAYIGGYGADLYNNLGVFLNTLNGSEWEIKYDDQSEKVAYDFVFNGIEPFLYETRTMDMVSSRDITRNGSTDRSRSSRILSALMPLRGTFPTMEQNTRFDSMMKYYISQDPYYYYSHMSSITSIQMAAELMNDESVRPRQNYTMTKTFAMDKTIHITPDFGFAVSMHSSRTYGHELINKEGKRTWNTSDGMFYLYDADENQYGGGFWATVDPTRLPGITAEHVTFNNGDGDRTKNVYDWTGGASLDSFGAAGTHIRTLGTPGSSSRNGTDVKKSYFMFGDRIVMMGSGITSSTGNTVETVVDNRKLLLDGSNAITVDSTTAALTETPTALENPGWLHVTGNVAGADVGYYFPENITVQAIKETRTGNWKDQGDTSGTATNTFATFYVDHGTKPIGASYEYVLLPGMTASETAAFATAPDVEILQNDSSVHAARDNANNVVAANFWESRTATVAGIVVDRAASVVMQRTGDIVTLSVADPTQQDKIITVSLASAGELVSSDANVTVVQTKPFVKLTVDTAGLGGGSSLVTLKLLTPEKLELVSAVTQLEPINVEADTPFLLLPLPKTAVFVAGDMQEHTVPITWSRNGYMAGAYGEFTVIATPELGDNYLNSAGVTLTATVLINGGQPQQLAECDTYVNDGSYADKVMGGGGTATGIPIKQDGTSYYRKALFRIDITTVPADCDEVYFTFQLNVPLDAGFLGAELYQVSNDWDQTTVTWNTRPTYTDGTSAASFKPGDVSTDGVVRLNVTAAVKAAQEAGLNAISFELTATGGAGSKNQASVRTLESDATQKPALVWNMVQMPGAADRSNLKMLIELAEGLDPARFINYDETAMHAAVAAAQQVLEDKGAGADKVNDAEDHLLALILALRVKPEIFIA